MRSAFIAPCLLMTAACTQAPPALPYATVGTYSGECGYDWNGAGAELESLERLAREWDRGHDAALLFRFDDVPQKCVNAAFSSLKRAGFVRVWIIPTPKPRTGDPPLVPSAR
jgi:hypothetical protein